MYAHNSPQQQYHAGHGDSWAPAPTYYHQPRVMNGFAVTSFVLGIFALIPFSGTSLLAIIFGHCGRGQIRRTGGRGKGLATAGLLLGYASILFLVLIVVFAVLYGETESTS